MSQLKTIGDWDEQYIDDLPLGEYDWLEFKGSRWLTLDSECLTRLSKYASAFANFDGGYLVVGVADPGSGDPLQIDGGVTTTLRKDLKGWLEDKIPSLTDPPLERLGVQQISGSGAGSRIKPGCAVLVIHVPASGAAPHQACDHKFYTRVGSKLSPVGTRAVADMLQRRKIPKIHTELRINIQNPKDSNLNWRVVNDSDAFALHVSARIWLPTHDTTSLYGPGVGFRFPAGSINENEESQFFWQLNTSNRNSTPLFPRGRVQQRFELKLGQPDPDESTIPKVMVRTWADEMPFVDEVFQLKDVLHRNH